MPNALDIKDYQSCGYWKKLSNNQVLNAKHGMLCNTFEDNAGAVQIVNIPMMRSRTKNLNKSTTTLEKKLEKGQSASITQSQKNKLQICSDNLSGGPIIYRVVR